MGPVKGKRAERRKKRAKGGLSNSSDYVLDQPPVYSGPSAPALPPSRVKPRPPGTPRRRRSQALPVVADFSEHAQTHFPSRRQRPPPRPTFKRAYAEAALKAGISRDQAVRIYGFETGGNGHTTCSRGWNSRPAQRRSAPRSATTSCWSPTPSACWPSMAASSSPSLEDRMAESRRRTAQELARQDRNAAADDAKFARSLPLCGASRTSSPRRRRAGAACAQSGHRHRPDAAGAETRRFGRVRPAQGVYERLAARRSWR